MKNSKGEMKHSRSSSENPDGLLSGEAQMNLGIVQSILGDYDAALANFQRARSHFEEVGDLARLAQLHYRRGMALLGKGVSAESLQEFEMSSSLSTKSGKRNLIGLAHLGKAYVYYGMHDIPAASSLADQALECFSLGDDHVHVAEVYKLKGMIRREEKQYELALWYLTTSLNIHRETASTTDAGSCYFELGKLYQGLRRSADARRAFRKSVSCFQQAGARNDAARATQELKSVRGDCR